MARDQVILNIPRGDWVQLTNANITSCTFQVQAGKIAIRGTTDETEPAVDAGGLIYSASDKDHQGEANILLSSLFAGSGINRVWAFGITAGSVYIDHA